MPDSFPPLPRLPTGLTDAPARVMRYLPHALLIAAFGGGTAWTSSAASEVRQEVRALREEQARSTATLQALRADLDVIESRIGRHEVKHKMEEQLRSQVEDLRAMLKEERNGLPRH